MLFAVWCISWSVLSISVERHGWDKDFHWQFAVQTNLQIYFYFFKYLRVLYALESMCVMWSQVPLVCGFQLYIVYSSKKKKHQLNKYLVIYHGVSCFLLLVVYVCVCAYMCVYSWWKYFRGTEEPDFAKWSNLTLMSSNIFKLSTCQCEVQHCISWLLGIHFPKRDFYILVKFPSDLDHSWRELWCFTMQFVFRTANTLKI